MRKDYGTRTKMKDGGKLKMVTNKEGKKVPFFAADGKGKMAMGGRVKKMGGGMMKRKPMMKGSKPDFLDLDKDKNTTEPMKQAAKQAKGMMKGGRVKKMGGGSMMKKREAMKKGSIPPQLKKFVMAKKKKAKMKKKKM